MAQPTATARPSRVLQWGVALILAGAWLAFGTIVWVVQGPFKWVAFDYGYFWCAAHASISAGAGAVFDLNTLADCSQVLSTYTHGSPVTLAAPPPYPPVYYFVLSPLAATRPDLGYLVWTAANLLATAMVARYWARRGGGGWWPVVMALVSFPIAYGVFVGQAIGFWLLALHDTYTSLERRQNFRAGLACGILLMKPQYAAFLAIVLLYKRQWAALKGLASAAGALAITSVWLLGRTGLMAVLPSIRHFSGVDPMHSDWNVPVGHEAYKHMVSWRGLLAQVVPTELAVRYGFAATVVLSAATVLALLIIWRGPWEPESERFPLRMLATLVVTMLAGFHNYVYGASLLLVPAAAFLVRPSGPRIVVHAVRWGALLPTVLFLATQDVILATIGVTITLLVILVATTFDERPAHFGPLRSPWPAARASAPAGVPAA